jgi:D-glycero-D-manno-heptose 1,7-bisphosphate phosphatase
VLIEDVHLLTKAEDMKLLTGVSAGLKLLRSNGFKLIMVTNQAVVARGLIDELQLDSIHADLTAMIQADGGGGIDAIYYCPHHPNADLLDYRLDCNCRKPKPGMLLQAAEEFQIDLQRSFMIGDRITDIVAGHEAGCKTIAVGSGSNLNNLIELSSPVDETIRPDSVCETFEEATHYIINDVTNCSL